MCTHVRITTFIEDVIVNVAVFSSPPFASPLVYPLQVIPLESSMKRPRNMPLVLDAAALVVVGLNLPFAVYGYLLFGEATKGERLIGRTSSLTYYCLCDCQQLLTFTCKYCDITSAFELCRVCLVASTVQS